MDGIARRISEVFEKIGISIKELADELTRIFEQINESGIFDIEPPARRRKRERDRARQMEQKYRAQIKRYARAGPFRRVYKPP